MPVKIKPKTEKDLAKMVEGGKKLAEIKASLTKKIRAGVAASEIEAKAVKLIKKVGGISSFKMVPGYSLNLAQEISLQIW